MKFIDIFLSESKKSELLAKNQGQKLLSALKRDTLADQRMSAEDIILKLEQMDPTNGKYLQWLVNRYIAGDFRLEDASRITTALNNFKQKQRGLEKKDINQYKSLHDLEEVVDEVSDEDLISNKELKRQTKSDGVEVIYDSDSYSIISPKTEQAACLYGSNTKWCTAGKKDNRFDLYNKKGPLYIILDHKNNRKYQLQYETAQFMDERDRGVDLKMLEKKYPEVKRLTRSYEKRILADGDPELTYNYAKEVINGRWPEAEPVIMKDPYTAYSYAIDIINGRWPDAEPYIMEDPEWATWYSSNILERRWPEAEPVIMKDPVITYKYARDVINGRWPEAEPVIMKDPVIAYLYSTSVIKGRWPEAEPYIMKYPERAHYYAVHVIKGRWPEAEPYIMKYPERAHYYAVHVIKGRWPEAEPFIIKDPEWSNDYAEKFNLEIKNNKFVEKNR